MTISCQLEQIPTRWKLLKVSLRSAPLRCKLKRHARPRIGPDINMKSNIVNSNDALEASTIHVKENVATKGIRKDNVLKKMGNPCMYSKLIDDH